MVKVFTNKDINMYSGCVALSLSLWVVFGFVGVTNGPVVILQLVIPREFRVF